MLIDVQNLDAGYGRKTVLHQVNLQFAGGAAGLLGPNGAGKSTLLKTLLGFIPPISGQVRVTGHTLPADALAVRARIGYMPEVEAFIPGINAVQFVAYMGELSGLPRPASMERAHEVLQYVGLGESRYRNLETYSLGMKQRAKLAQAIVHDPTLLLLDEPTNGMDPAGRLEMLDLVNDLSRNKGMSVILCSHLLKDVDAIADEIIVMGNGQVTSRQLHVRNQRDARELVYGVRVRGNRQAFAEQLRSDGMEVAERADEPALFVRVTHPEAYCGEATQASATQPIYRAAAATGCVVQRLEQRREKLEEIFVQAVGELGNAHL